MVRIGSCGIVWVAMLVACAQDGLEDGDASERIAPATAVIDPSASLADGYTESAVAQSKLARLRAATAKYHDVDLAIADGFAPTDRCVELPGVGAMGYHFVNFARLMDPLDIEHPEVLLYMKQGDHFRLVAVEFVSVILENGAPYMGCGVENNSCPPSDPGDAPVLFGNVAFNGPMAGHEPGMPWHYDQHVWLYAHNPAGLFAQFNPTLACPAECEH